jgi:hypothetical protein
MALSVNPVVSDDATRCRNLAERAAAGDAGAWQAFVALVWPSLRDLVRSNRSMGDFAQSEDDVREVISAIVEKLGSRGYHGLKLHEPWRVRNPDKTFEDWLRIVSKNVIRDYVRERLETPVCIRQVARELQWPSACITGRLTANEVAAFAMTRLDAAHYEALVLWLQGESFDDIRDQLCLDNADLARQLVRASLAVLRRHFTAKTRRATNMIGIRA